MTPYYDDGQVTIFHGDCREVLPALEAESVIITDQPYGTGWVRGGKGVGEFEAKHENPDWDVFSLDWIDLVPLCNALPKPGVLYYVKTNVRPGGINRESIVCSPPPQRGPWKFSAYNGDAPLHPCQKPMPVMCWLVRTVADEGDMIVDPFCGSGSTLVAAKAAGHRAIGVDVSERYCEIAANRLRQRVLFGAPELEPVG